MQADWRWANGFGRGRARGPGRGRLARHPVLQSVGRWSAGARDTAHGLAPRAGGGAGRSGAQRRLHLRPTTIRVRRAGLPPPARAQPDHHACGALAELMVRAARGSAGGMEPLLDCPAGHPDTQRFAGERLRTGDGRALRCCAAAGGNAGDRRTRDGGVGPARGLPTTPATLEALLSTSRGGQLWHAVLGEGGLRRGRGAGAGGGDPDAVEGART